MKTQLPSLITSDAQAGMALACELAEQMQTHHEQAARLVERPGGMNYLIAPKMSVEACQLRPFLRDCRGKQRLGPKREGADSSP